MAFYLYPGTQETFGRNKLNYTRAGFVGKKLVHGLKIKYYFSSLIVVRKMVFSGRVYHGDTG